MRITPTIIALGLILMIFTSLKKPTINPLLADECEVANFYKAIEADSGVKVITTYGDLEDAEIILIPTQLDEGTYELEITRKESNIYKVEGTDYYIETRYCYEYATYDDVYQKVESNYGYTKGTVYFN